MTEMDPQKLSGIGKNLFHKIEFDNDEKLLVEIRKHPFGLWLRYITGIFVITIFSIVFFVVPFLMSDEQFLGVDKSNFQSIVTLIGFVLVVLAILATGISAYLYESNVLIITSDKMAQVLNKSIFSQKISQLSIGDVQDVTVTQNGFFPRIFNYGTVIIETAGEQSNLIFNFTPDPYNKAKVIVGSHEENLKKYGN